MGLDGHEGGLDLPPAPAYVVFLVDGLGAELLARHGHSAPYLSSLVADGSTEQVDDNGPNGHSIFTWTVLQGLEGRADMNSDGFISGATLDINGGVYCA